MEIASRLFRASDSRPVICIRPARRQSSVNAVKGTPRTTPECSPRAPAPDAAVSFAAAVPPFFLRKPNGTRSVLLSLAAVVPDGVDDRRIRERRHVTQLATLGDVPQQPAHDLAG